MNDLAKQLVVNAGKVDALLAETSGNSNIKTIDLHKYLRED